MDFIVLLCQLLCIVVIVLLAVVLCLKIFVPLFLAAVVDVVKSLTRRNDNVQR